jgi:hypothetical protein
MSLYRRCGDLDRDQFTQSILRISILNVWHRGKFMTRLVSYEATLRTRGRSKRPVQTVGDLALALIRAGYAPPTAPVIAEIGTEESEIGAPPDG